MPQPKFNIGDVVVLNSGSPSMTVKEVIENPIDDSVSYRCQWFTKETLKDGVFAENTIEKDEPIMPFSV